MLIDGIITWSKLPVAVSSKRSSNIAKVTNPNDMNISLSLPSLK